MKSLMTDKMQWSISKKKDLYRETMKTLPFLPYAKHSIRDQDIESVGMALREELITRGPLVQQFENEIAVYCRVPYAVAFTSGTAALMAAYFAARLTSRDHVFSTPNTFIATIAEPVKIGIRPHFIDLDLSTGNLCLNKLFEAMDFKSTRGRPFIVPVHFAGLAIDMATLDRQIKIPETVIIEDAAHAFGSFYPSGEKVGSCAFSHLTVFSFHPAKILTTGEGGVVTTRDPDLFHRLQLFRNNGIEACSPYLNRTESLGYYEVQEITGNFNFTSFQAALGISQLKRIKNFINKRRALIQNYRDRLKDVPHIKLLTEAQDAYSAFHLFVIQIDFSAYKTTREIVMYKLKSGGIGTQIHYIPLYYHPALKNHVEMRGKCPQTEQYYRQTLSLPLYYDLHPSDVVRVCDELIKTLMT